MKDSKMDIRFMQQAIDLSREKMLAGEGGPFGAVIVLDGEIIGKGWNRVSSTNDPTAHAEIVAIRNSCETLNTFELNGCVLYSSCEPCPMCLGAAYWAGIRKVVYGADRFDAEKAGFRDNFIYLELTRQNHQRIIEMEQILKEESINSFKLWEEFEDKIEY